VSAAGQTICLSMIVKNEAPVIRRCLNSVRSIIDCWVIVDTGSTDGTQDIIREYLKDLPGELYERRWRDFAHNRSEALTLARPLADYSLIIDADDVLEIHESFQLPELTADAYTVDIRDASICYQRTQLVRNTLPWRYQGVLHEFLTCEGSRPSEHLQIAMRRNHDGARRRDPETYRRDVALLENALLSETDPFLISRYTFYLAQSYRDCGEKAKAIEAYLRRAELGHWNQEVFCSLYSAAQLKEELGHDRDEVIELYLRASDTASDRVEGLHGASRLCRNSERYEQGYDIAKRALALRTPLDGLFVEPWIYDYGLLDEFAVNAYWAGRYQYCLGACERLLSEGKLPSELRDRVLANRDFAIGMLRQDPEVPSDAFVQLLYAARQKEELGYADDEVISAYMAASASCPTRAEALHGAARFCRNRGIYERGYEFAAEGLAIAFPKGAPFVEEWIYDYGLLDELAVNAYWVDKYQDCLDACQRLLSEGKMTQDMRDRVEKNAQFAVDKIKEQDRYPQRNIAPIAKSRSDWVPEGGPAGGTELIVAGLKERMGEELDRINLQINHPGNDQADKRPLVVWMHHDIDQAWIQWCKDKDLVDTVSCFVFVSYWQREQYLNAFGLPSQRCVVLRHALDVSADRRRWEAEPVLRCAYTSTPFRGLSVLLDAWGRVNPTNAELHVWSSMKLYLADDRPYEDLYARAESLPGVIYHGIAPNRELRAALRSMHFLLYPCTFRETACLAVIEAMAAGCRVVIPSLGALPETSAGYARIYPSPPDAQEHAAIFSENLAAELAVPWAGAPELSLSQQAYCGEVYDWSQRLREWRHLIHWICSHADRSR